MGTKSMNERVNGSIMDKWLITTTTSYISCYVWMAWHGTPKLKEGGGGGCLLSNIFPSCSIVIVFFFL